MRDDFTDQKVAPLDTIYTAEEAAERFRLTKRALIKIARRIGACSVTGRHYLFSEADLLAIWQEMREPAKAPKSPTVNASRSYGRSDLDLHMLTGSGTALDGRVIGILEGLARLKAPVTYKKIDRAGEKTIQLMLEKGVVTHCGVDAEGLTLVKISPAGHDELKAIERRKKYRKSLGLRR